MFGEPDPVDGECNACLFIADNYGDGSATIRCQLPPKHPGLHQEQFDREGGQVTITWHADERERCNHGCGQWRHEHRDDAIQCPKDADDHEFSDCVFCHPDEPPLTCVHCGKAHYYSVGHLRHCTMKPFSCEVCGECGAGNHDWPMGCPKAREILGGGALCLVEVRRLPQRRSDWRAISGVIQRFSFARSQLHELRVLALQVATYASLCWRPSIQRLVSLSWPALKSRSAGVRSEKHARTIVRRLLSHVSLRSSRLYERALLTMRGET